MKNVETKIGNPNNMGKVRIFANSPQKLDSQHYSDL